MCLQQVSEQNKFIVRLVPKSLMDRFNHEPLQTNGRGPLNVQIGRSDCNLDRD